MNTIYSAEQHPNSDQLLQVLEMNCESGARDPVREHVESCPKCQKALESLAAGPEFWCQASTLSGRDTIEDTIAAISDSALFPPVWMNADRMAKPSPDGDDVFPLQSLFSRPAHPEMLGRLANYDIEFEIGRGGMGVVFKAFDADLNRPVAIKLMAPLLAGRGVARERFAREARAAAAILHPNVIAIYGVAVADKIPYIVMPFIKGPSIEQLVEENGPINERDLVCFAMQMAAGLSAAHAQGVVHRDIKPANILIENGVGRVVITDFGLARAESEVSMTQTGWFAGTPAFMSPEQAKGDEADSRSDLFSLGGVMYYMATGRVPFRAEQPMAVLERIRNEAQRSAIQLNSQISPMLSDLIDWLLEKDPDKRIQSAAGLHELLEQYLAHLHDPKGIEKPRFVSAGARARKRNRVRNALVATVFTGLAAAGFLFVTKFSAFGKQPSNGADTVQKAKSQSLVVKPPGAPDMKPWPTIEEDFNGIEQAISGLADPTGAGLHRVDPLRFAELDAGIAQLEQALTHLEQVLGPGQQEEAPEK